MAAEQPVARAALDDVAIRSLLARLAHLADTGDLAGYADCFTEDARWDMPGAPRNGLADIVDGARQRRAAGETGPGSATRHVVGTTAVQVEQDRARATSYFQFYGRTDAAPQLLLIGQYDDELLRTPAGWRIERRRITLG